MEGDFEKLVYEEALRGLDSQEELVRELRSRTNTLLAVSSLAASFLGQQAFKSSGSGFLVLAASLAFVVSVAATVFVLLPKRELIFAGNGARTYELLYEERDDMPAVYRRLAYEHDSLWNDNIPVVTALLRAYTLAAVASVLELLSLAALTWGNVLYS